MRGSLHSGCASGRDDASWGAAAPVEMTHCGWGCASGRDDAVVVAWSLFLLVVDGLFGGGEDFFGDGLRDDVVVVHLHAEAAAALRHGGERGAVGEDFGH